MLQAMKQFSPANQFTIFTGDVVEGEVTFRLCFFLLH